MRHGLAGVPGRGGVTRGRGDAALDFSGETEGRTDAFEARELPAAERADPESTGLVGVGGAAPEVDPLAEGAGAADVRASAGKSAFKRRVAPRHRDAVQGFFGGKE